MKGVPYSRQTYGSTDRTVGVSRPEQEFSHGSRTNSTLAGLRDEDRTLRELAISDAQCCVVDRLQGNNRDGRVHPRPYGVGAVLAYATVRIEEEDRQLRRLQIHE